MATLDGIVRVSKTGDRAYLRSDKQQAADLRAWAKDNGHELATIHVAIDESGGKGNHPVIETAKQRALSGDTDGFVAPYLSRFSRNTLYGLNTVQQILDAGKQFYSLDCPFDLRSKEGRKYLTKELADAEFEWHKAKENFARGVREAVVDNGCHIAVSFGYRRSNGKGSPLAPDPNEAPTVQLAYELRKQGFGYVAIANTLNERGLLPRKRGGKQTRWTHNAVKKMTQAEVYLGVAYCAPYRREDAHEPLVSRALWDAANRSKGTRRNAPQQHLLTGLVRCVGCGYSMQYSPQGGRGYYVCKPYQHTVGCPAPGCVPAQRLEEMMDAVMVDVIGDIALRPVTDDADVEAAQSAVNEAEAVLARAYQEKLRTPDAPASVRRILQAELDSFAAELTDAEAELERAKGQARGVDLPAGLTPAGYLDLPVEDRRQLLAAFFAGVAVRPAAQWREDMALRTRPVAGHEMGDTDPLAFFAGLDW